MSQQIDEKVVSLQFENEAFEKKADASVKTLEKLQKSMDFKDAAKGFGEIDKSAKNVDMSVLANGVQTVEAKFSAMSVVAITALTRITNAAITAGKDIVSALTIDPIKTGLAEYETYINSIQVIKSNTRGKSTMEDITAALDDLNTYADKTIYNFTQMTSNIGKFTAQGLDAKQAAEAVKGMANLAAASGASATDMARATYQMSQALGGTIKLIDWNSLRNANMATVTLKNTLMDLARVHGIAIDDMIAEEGTFEATLSKGWLSGEMFTEAMNIYSGVYSEAELKAKGFTDEQVKNFVELAKDAEQAATEVKTLSQLWDVLKETAQSGWTNSWKWIIGDYDQAKKDLTALQVYLSDIINKSAEARNKLLEGWNKAGGRDTMIEGLKNIWEALGSVIKPIKEAFREIFPPMTVERLLKLTEGFRDFTEKLKLSEKAQNALKSAFKAFFSVIDIGLRIIKAIIHGIVQLLSNFTAVKEKIYDGITAVGNWISSLRDSIVEHNTFITVIDALCGAFKRLIDAVKNFFKGFNKESKEAGNSGPTFFSKLADALVGLWNIITKIGSRIADFFKSIGSALLEGIKNGQIPSIMALFQQGAFAGLMASVSKFMTSLKGTLSENLNFFKKIEEALGLNDFSRRISKILGSVSRCLNAFAMNVRAEALIKIGIAIAILSASLLLLSTIPADKIAISLGGIAGIISELMGTLAIMNKIPGGGVFDSLLGIIGKDKMNRQATALIKISAAILILAIAVKAIASIEPDRVASSVAAIGALMMELTATTALMSQQKSGIKGALDLLALADVIKKLANACVSLSELDWSQLARGLAGLGGIMGELALFLQLTQGKKFGFWTGMALIEVAISLKILYGVCKKFSEMSWEEIAKGLVSVAGLLTAVSIAINTLPKSTALKTLGLINLSLALLLLIPTMKILSGFSWEEIAKGLVSISGALAAITISVNALPDTMFFKSLGLTSVSFALLMLIPTLKTMAGMSWEQLSRGLIGLAGALTAITIAMRQMPPAPDTLAIAGGLAILSAALLMLLPTIGTFAAIGWQGLITSLAGIAGVFVTLGLAVKALSKIIPAIFSVSGALITLSLSMFILSLSFLSLSASFALAAITGVAGATAFVSALQIVIMGYINLIPLIIDAVKRTILAITQMFIECAPQIADAIYALVMMGIDVLVRCVPALAEGAFKLIVQMLEMLNQYAPQIVNLILDFVIKLLNILAERIPELVGAIANVIGAIVDAVGECIKGISSDDILKLTWTIFSVGFVMQYLSRIRISLPTAAANVAQIGVILAELTGILTALGAINQIPGLQWLVDSGGDLLESVGTAIGKFIGGIVGGIANGIVGNLPEIGTNLSAFMENVQPFIDSAKNIDASAMEGAQALAGAILALTEASLFDSIANAMGFLLGKRSFADFAEQMIPFGEAMAEFSETVSGKIDGDAVEAAANAGKMLTEMSKTIPNSGGLLGRILGNNDLDDFAAMIVPFGEAMAKFSETVAGKIDAEAVQGAAAAGKVLTEMAKTIPNSGGWLGKFVGDNDLDDFSAMIVVYGEAMVAFSESISGISMDNSTVRQAITITKALSKIANEIPSTGGFLSVFTGRQSLANFGVQMSCLGKGLASFGASVKEAEFDDDKTTSAINIANALSQLEVKKVGGIVSWIAGTSDLATFALQVACLGKGLASFGASVKEAEFDDDKTTSAINIANALSQLEVKKVGGIVSWIAGTSDLATFALQVACLGKGLASFGASVKEAEFDDDKTTSAINIANALSQLEVKKVGGIVSWIAGTSDLATFALQVACLGQGLASFATKINEGTFPEYKTSKAISIAKQLSELDPEKVGGMVSVWGGTSDLATFGSKLEGLATGLVAFANVIAESENLDSDRISTATSAITSLADASKAINEVEGGTANLSNFGSHLTNLGIGLKDYGDKVMAIDFGRVAVSKGALTNLKDLANDYAAISVDDFNSAITAFNSLMDVVARISGTDTEAISSFASSMGTIGTDSVNAFIAAFTDATDDATTAAEGIYTAIETVFNDKMESFKTLGTNAYKAINVGFSDYGTTFSDTARNICTSVKSTLTTYDSSFYSAGANWTAGLAGGIGDRNAVQMVINAAASVARSAINTTTTVLDEQSPSHIAQHIGQFYTEGLAIGISDYAGMVIESSEYVGDSAIAALTNSISSIGSLLDSELIEPTITPILDLSNVRNGISTMNGIIGNQTMKVNTSFSNNNQNGQSVNEIKTLIDLNREMLAAMAGMQSATTDTTEYIKTINNMAKRPIVTQAYLDGRSVGYGVASYVSDAQNQTAKIKKWIKGAKA